MAVAVDKKQYQLTTAEIEKAIRKFSALDTDGDGRVNFEDYLAFHQRKEKNLATKVTSTASNIATTTVKRSQSLKASARQRIKRNTSNSGLDPTKKSPPQSQTLRHNHKSSRPSPTTTTTTTTTAPNNVTEPSEENLRSFSSVFAEENPIPEKTKVNLSTSSPATPQSARGVFGSLKKASASAAKKTSQAASTAAKMTSSGILKKRTLMDGTPTRLAKSASSPVLIEEPVEKEASSSSHEEIV